MSVHITERNNQIKRYLALVVCWTKCASIVLEGIKVADYHDVTLIDSKGKSYVLTKILFKLLLIHSISWPMNPEFDLQPCRCARPHW